MFGFPILYSDFEITDEILKHIGYKILKKQHVITIKVYEGIYYCTNYDKGIYICNPYGCTKQNYNILKHYDSKKELKICVAYSHIDGKKYVLGLSYANILIDTKTEIVIDTNIYHGVKWEQMPIIVVYDVKNCIALEQELNVHKSRNRIRYLRTKDRIQFDISNKVDRRIQEMENKDIRWV